MKMIRPSLLLAVAILLTLTSIPITAWAQAEKVSPRLEAVRVFADTALKHGRDTYGKVSTPLFVDGLNLETLEPVRWMHKDEAWIPSNLACQQDMLRTLVGLSNLTGDPQYRNAAASTVKYHIEHLQTDSGLFQWGGHRLIDLVSDEPRGAHSMPHELKNVLPYYEFFWEVDPKATERFIKAFWTNHMLDWSKLDMTRHGSYDKKTSKLWESEFAPADSLFEGNGLTFINSGSDMIYSAVMLYRLNGDKGALLWAKRMAKQYVRVRHPKTGLGVFQYSSPKRLKTLPANTPIVGKLTYSHYGDRAEIQFGDEFGSIAREAYWLDKPKIIYGNNAIMQLQLAEMLGEEGKEFITWTVDGLKAFAHYMYDPKTNTTRPMWADGTDLTGYVIKRSGYYGSKGRVLKVRPADRLYLCSFLLGYRLSEDKELWQTARDMACGFGLGDIGTAPGEKVKLNLKTDNSDPTTLFALLELCRISEDQDYRDLAIRLGDNIVEQRFHNGLFAPSEKHRNGSFNALEPFALLSLEAMLQGRPEAVPSWSNSLGYFDCPFDGVGRASDWGMFWHVLRKPSSPGSKN